MGYVIYIDGEITSNVSLDRHTEDKLRNAARNRVDFDDSTGLTKVTFPDEIEGINPYSDYFLLPLTCLLEEAKKQKAYFNGEFKVRANISDYDNILIEVTDSEAEFSNLEVRGASTTELVRELKRRKVLPDDFNIQEGQKC